MSAARPHEGARPPAGEGGAERRFGEAYATTAMGRDPVIASLLALLETAPTPGERLSLMLDLSEHLVGVDAAQAMQYAEDAESLATSLARPGPRAEALHLKGRSAEHLLDYPRALGWYADALIAFEAVDDMRGIAKVLRALGFLHDALGDFPTALDHLFRALALDERVGDNGSRAATLRTIGIVHSKSGDIATGLDYYRQSLALADAENHPAERAKTLNNLGINLKNLGKTDEALHALVEARDIFERMGLSLHKAGALNNLGLAQERAGQLDVAEATLRDALDLSQKSGYGAGVANARLALGRLCSRQQRHDEGRAYLEAALALCQRHGLRQLAAECHEALADHHESQGDYAAALTHYRHFHKVEREVLSESAGNKVRALQIHHEVEAARREAEMMRERQEALSKANAELEALNASLTEANVVRISLVDQLERQTYEDALTGLANRRRLDLRLSESFALVQRHGRPLAVAVADLDHFKRVNDEHSHAIGDAVLKTLAQLLQSQVRQTDLVARYGGEEFVLVLSETDAEAAYVVCEKVRNAVEQHAWSEIARGLALTVSIGFCADTSLQSAERMLAAADAELYAAKGAGRNCISGTGASLRDGGDGARLAS
ncbi:MAG TPA: diguanylate cyclase [Casimicrobiaceae bacterium]|jgi:diguanylate cyclase (GGDEF)-like protein